MSNGDGVIVYKFNLDLWPFDPKIKRGFPTVMDNTLFDVTSKWSYPAETTFPQTDKRMDRQSWWNQYTLNFVGGVKIIMIAAVLSVYTILPC